MFVSGQIFPFDCVDYGEVHLLDTSILILIDLGTLILKPLLLLAILVARDIGGVCLTILGDPIYTILRALVVGYTSQPIVYYQVIL